MTLEAAVKVLNREAHRGHKDWCIKAPDTRHGPWHVLSSDPAEIVLRGYEAVAVALYYQPQPPDRILIASGVDLAGLVIECHGPQAQHAQHEAERKLIAAAASYLERWREYNSGKETD